MVNKSRIVYFIFQEDLCDLLKLRLFCPNCFHTVQQQQQQHQQQIELTELITSRRSTCAL